MNAGSAERQPFAPQHPPREGWGFSRWFIFLVLAVAAHFAFVFLFGAKKTVPPRAVTNAFQIQLAAGGGEFAALTDPTLFARPHETLDFFPAAWRLPPAVDSPAFTWTEPPPFLKPAAENLGAAFNLFLQTNQLAMQTLNFKPEPQVTEAGAVFESALPQASSLKIIGRLAQRRLLNQIAVPTLACNDVLPPSRVQVLVDATGVVMSAVLLQLDGPQEAATRPDGDNRALALARRLRFAPAPQPELGEVIFTWHTVPTNAP